MPMTMEAPDFIADESSSPAPATAPDFIPDRLPAAAPTAPAPPPATMKAPDFIPDHPQSALAVAPTNTPHPPIAAAAPPAPPTESNQQREQRQAYEKVKIAYDAIPRQSNYAWQLDQNHPDSPDAIRHAAENQTFILRSKEADGVLASDQMNGSVRDAARTFTTMTGAVPAAVHPIGTPRNVTTGEAVPAPTPIDPKNLNVRTAPERLADPKLAAAADALVKNPDDATALNNLTPQEKIQIHSAIYSASHDYNDARIAYHLNNGTADQYGPAQEVAYKAAADYIQSNPQATPSAFAAWYRGTIEKAYGGLGLNIYDEAPAKDANEAARDAEARKYLDMARRSEHPVISAVSSGLAGMVTPQGLAAFAVPGGKLVEGLGVKAAEALGAGGMSAKTAGIAGRFIQGEATHAIGGATYMGLVGTYDQYLNHEPMTPFANAAYGALAGAVGGPGADAAGVLARGFSPVLQKASRITGAVTAASGANLATAYVQAHAAGRQLSDDEISAAVLSGIPGAAGEVAHAGVTEQRPTSPPELNRDAIVSRLAKDYPDLKGADLHRLATEMMKSQAESQRPKNLAAESPWAKEVAAQPTQEPTNATPPPQAPAAAPTGGPQGLPLERVPVAAGGEQRDAVPVGAAAAPAAAETPAKVTAPPPAAPDFIPDEKPTPPVRAAAPLQENQHAIQEPGPKGLDVREQTANGQTVAGGHAQGQEVAAPRQEVQSPAVEPQTHEVVPHVAPDFIPDRPPVRTQAPPVPPELRPFEYAAPARPPQVQRPAPSPKETPLVAAPEAEKTVTVKQKTAVPGPPPDREPRTASEMLLHHGVTDGIFPNDFENDAANRPAVHPDALEGKSTTEQRTLRGIGSEDRASNITDDMSAAQKARYEKGVRERHGADTEQRLAQAIEHYKDSPDSNLRKLAAYADAEGTGPKVTKPVSAFKNGDEFTLGGRKFRAEIDAQGNTHFTDDDMDIPYAEGTMKYDAGSLQKGEQTAGRKKAVGAAGAESPEFSDTAAKQDPEATGIKNSISAEDRKRIGAPDRETPEGRSFDDMYSAGKNLDDADPAAIDRLLATMKSNPEHVVTSKDEAGLLLKHKVDMEREFQRLNKAVGDAYAAGDEPAEKLASLQMDLHRQKMLEFTQLMEQAGTAAGRALVSRKMLSGMDYSLSKMEMSAQAAKGSKLTSEEVTRIGELHDQMQKHMAEIDAADEEYTKQQTLARVDEAIQKMKEAASLKPSVVEPHIKSLADRIILRLDKLSADAEARLKARGIKVMAGLDPMALKDMTIITAAEIAKGVTKLADLTAKMVAKFGDGIRPHMPTIFKNANKELDRAIERSTGRHAPKVKAALAPAPTPADIVGKMKDRITAGAKPEDLQAYIRKIGMELVKGGVKDREPFLDALHAEVKKAIPDITRDQVRDIFSGYGDFKPLDKNADKVALRDLQQQSQKVAQLEALQKGKAPLKTGMEQQPLSDTGRQLQQKVDAAKKTAGIVATDPERQLKTTLDSLKTRVKNQIADLQTEIDTGERIVAGKPVPISDAELETLRGQLAQVREAHAEIFQKPGLTDQERVELATAAAKKNLESWQERLDKARRGVFDSPEEKRVVSAPELDALKAQTAVAKQEYAELDRAAHPPQTASERQEKALQKNIDVINEKLKTGDVSVKGPKQGPDTAAVDALKKQRDILTARLQELRKAAEPRNDPQANALEKAVKKLNERIAAGNLEPVKQEKQGPDTAHVAALKAQRDTLTARLQELRDNDPTIQARKAAENAERSAAEYQRKADAGEFVTKGKPTPMETARLKDAILARDQAKKAYGELRKKDPAYQQYKNDTANEAYRTNLARREADLKARMAKDDYSPRKVTPQNYDAKTLQAKANYAKVREQYEAMNRAFQYKNRSLGKKVLGAMAEPLNVARSIMTSMDFSAMLRQGGFIAFGNPIRAARAVLPMLRAFTSENQNRLEAERIATSPNAPLYKAAKLYIAEPGGGLSHQEEGYMSQWAGKIPGVKHSERAYVTFLNKLRADSFDAMVATLTRGKKAVPEELAAIANFINKATGRGSLGSAEQAAVALNTIFFSPRNLVSRFQLLAGQPFYKGSMQTRKIIMGEYAKTLVGLGLVYALGTLAGGKVEDDARSSDFGKIRFGNTRLDPLTGIAQIMVLAKRLYSGETKSTTTGKITDIRGPNVPYGQDTASDYFWKFSRNKLAPGVAAGFNIADKETATGEPTSAPNELAKLYTPMIYNDMKGAIEDLGVPKGVAVGLLAMLGVGVQTYEQKKQK